MLGHVTSRNDLLFDGTSRAHEIFFVGGRAQDGWTALMSAAYSGHMKVVELLLEKGAKTGAINNVSY